MRMSPQQQQEARDLLNQLAQRLHPDLSAYDASLPRPDLILAQALEAARAFVPAELVSVIETILDGYTVHTARHSLARLYEQDTPVPALGILTFPASRHRRTHQFSPRKDVTHD
jgi:hypothetical protein